VKIPEHGDEINTGEYIRKNTYLLLLAVFGATLPIVTSSIYVAPVSHAGARTQGLLSYRCFESHARIRPDDQIGKLAIQMDKAVPAFMTDLRE
jgi:hypothetical protein